MRAAKPLIHLGVGRSAEVFAHSPGEVLRRYRVPRDTRREVAVMEHVRAHGYPVPAARAIDDTDIVMDRLDGPTMLDELGRRPWRIGRHAAALAALHRRLAAIPAPDWLPQPLGGGHAMLHLDLHPDNVMITDRGPFVIDWPNAARGPGEGDVAHTWIVLACSVPTTGAYRRAVSAAGRGLFLRVFLRHFDRDSVARWLGAAGAYRLVDRTLPQQELDAIRRLIAESGPQSSSS